MKARKTAIPIRIICSRALKNSGGLLVTTKSPTKAHVYDETSSNLKVLPIRFNKSIKLPLKRSVHLLKFKTICFSPFRANRFSRCNSINLQLRTTIVILFDRKFVQNRNQRERTIQKNSLEISSGVGIGLTQNDWIDTVKWNYNKSRI